MNFGLHFGMMVHLDPIEVKFEGQGHRSKFTTQVEKCSFSAMVLGTVSTLIKPGNILLEGALLPPRTKDTLFRHLIQNLGDTTVVVNNAMLMT